MEILSVRVYVSELSTGRTFVFREERMALPEGQYEIVTSLLKQDGTWSTREDDLGTCYAIEVRRDPAVKAVDLNSYGGLLDDGRGTY